MPSATLSLKTVAPLADAECDHQGSGLRKKAITVCHPVWSLESGGLEGQMLRIIGGGSSERFHHLVIVRGPSDARTSCELPDNVEVICQDGPQRDHFWSRRLSSLLVDHHVDVLHLRGLTMLTDGVLAAQFAGTVRVAMSFHGFESNPPQIGPIRRRVLHWGIGRCDERWAVSASAAAALAMELNMEADEFDVVPNGVDTLRFSPAADRGEIRRRLGLPVDRPIILAVGNLKPIKGHNMLLEAVAHLPAHAALDSPPRREGDAKSPGDFQGGVSRATVVFVGHDYLHGALQRYAASQLAGRDIRFVGRQDDVAPWCQAADIFVLPSHGEGLSNALLEAMACGLPVLATSVGGNCDVIEHGRTGLLVQPNGPQQLADAIAGLLSDESQRAALGDAARRHVQQFFNITQTRAEYERRYEKLAGRVEDDE